MSDRAGMCGNRSPMTSFGGRELCVLAAGHAGWHEGAPLWTDHFGVVEPLHWTHNADADQEATR